MYPLKIKAKYDPNNLPATWNVFTTVYLGNYIDGDFEQGHGSHPGVDIIPARPNDDIHACLPGVVHFAGTNASNGNYVVLKHPNAPHPDDHAKTTTFYSCHLHMNALAVATGDTVDEGDVIGQSGNTGNSTGEHLHFQIDTMDAPFHPYWPFTYAESKAAGLGFFDAVNKGLGLENARKYTINPLVYLDSVAGISTKPVTPEVEKKPVDEDGFIDVDPRTKYYNAIKYLADKKIISGSNGRFFPEGDITRAELVKIVFGAAGITPDASLPNEFKDVDAGAWYAPYVATAKAKKIIGGYSDGTFKPNKTITRAEALKVIINTLQNDTLDNVSFKVFDDVNTTDWFAPYANFAKVSELLDFGGNMFEPNRTIERAEVANAVYVLMK